MTPRTALVVLDWDGTVLDSIGTIIGCTRCALEELGLPMPAEDRIRGAIGLGLQESVAHLFPHRDVELAPRVAAAYRKHWFATFSRRAEPFPGAEQTLAELRRREYTLAVATAKSRKGLEVDLERTGLGRFFQHTRTAGETAPKPEPTMLCALMSMAGVAADETIMVGDTEHDLEMARRARVTAVAVASGAIPRLQLEARTPAACLDALEELVPWLDRRDELMAPVGRSR